MVSICSRMAPNTWPLVSAGGRFVGHDRRLGACRHRGKHVLFAFDQRGSIIAGRFESMAVGNRVGGARLYAIPAENTAIVIDVVDLGVALAAGNPRGGSVLGGFDIDTVGRACRGAQE